MADNTVGKQRGKPFKSGQSGNPFGRPKGSRSKLGEDFVSALYADFQINGAAAIERVRIEKPDQYLKVIATLVPKELQISADPLGDASDDELVGILDMIRTLTPKQGKPN